MNHSLNQIGSQILNAVYAGLKGPSNFAVSIEQIKDEVIQERERQAKALAGAGTYIRESFAQNIPKLTLIETDMSGIPGYDSNRKVLWAKIPELIYAYGFKPVLFVTVPNYGAYFKVVYGNDFFYVSNDRYTANAPTIWIKDTDLYLLNPPTVNTKTLAARMVFENPRALNGMYGILISDDDPFPAPADVVSAIRNKLVNDYLRQYRLANPVPAIVASDLISQILNPLKDE